MKSLKIARDLVLYNLRLLPWYLWVLLALTALMEVQWARIMKEWVIGGLSTTHLDGFPIIFFAIIGTTFFRTRAGYAGGPIPDGEFLLTRPILRRTAYLSRTALYFVIMLVIPLVGVHIATAKPDLRVDFYNWADPNIIAGQVKFYQDQFPESSMIHQPYPAFRKEAYDTTLIIPFGAVKVALWDLLVAMALALTLQTAMLFVSSSKFRGMSFFGLLLLAYFFGSVLLVMIFPQLRGNMYAV